jgi:hypothetical protein
MTVAVPMPFRAILLLLGAINVFLGLNLGLGGILTMGWQGQTQFFEVLNEHAYLVQDSHIRFFGGLYVALGAFLLVASTNVVKYAGALNLALLLMFAGGVARFSMMRTDILFGPEIVGSLAAELLLMPALFLWLRRIVRSASPSA